MAAARRAANATHPVTLDSAFSSGAERGAPYRIYVDNGPEFVSKCSIAGPTTGRSKLPFSRLGKPTDNAFIASFNGRLRQECLNQRWFLSLADARSKIERGGRATTRADPRCFGMGDTGRIRPPALASGRRRPVRRTRKAQLLNSSKTGTGSVLDLPRMGFVEPQARRRVSPRVESFT